MNSLITNTILTLCLAAILGCSNQMASMKGVSEDPIGDDVVRIAGDIQPLPDEDQPSEDDPNQQCSEWEYGEWTPSPANTCDDSELIQTAEGTRTCEQCSGNNCKTTTTKTRSIAGTRDCTSPTCSSCSTGCTAWKYGGKSLEDYLSKAADSVCIGERSHYSVAGKRTCSSQCNSCSTTTTVKRIVEGTERCRGPMQAWLPVRGSLVPPMVEYARTLPEVPCSSFKNTVKYHLKDGTVVTTYWLPTVTRKNKQLIEYGGATKPGDTIAYYHSGYHETLRNLPTSLYVTKDLCNRSNIPIKRIDVITKIDAEDRARTKGGTEGLTTYHTDGSCRKEVLTDVEISTFRWDHPTFKPINFQGVKYEGACLISTYPSLAFRKLNCAYVQSLGLQPAYRCD